MTTPHKATPEQWARLEKWSRVDGASSDNCILELRDRLAAAEQRIQALDAAANLQQQDEDAERAMEHQTLHTIALQMVDSLGRSFHLIPEILDTLRRAIREPMEETESCPHIVTSNEGTSYCGLAEHGNSSAGLTGSNHPAKPDSSPAPAGGLVERVERGSRQGLLDNSPVPAGGLLKRVGQALIRSEPGYDKEARAAILAVADWLQGIRALEAGNAARWLREEVERHG